MNRDEHLLTCLAEECVEVAKECSKALRFGLDDTAHVLTDDGTGFREMDGGPHPTARQKIEAELGDLLGVVYLCWKAGLIDVVRTNTAKAGRVERFMEYARSKGTLI